MNRKFTLNLVLFSCTLIPAFAQGLNFQKMANSGFQNMTAGDIVFFDANDDGALDILLTGETSVFPPQPSTKLYLNDGSGNFTEMATSLPNVGLSAVGHADIDNDGDEDLFICGAGGGSMPNPVSALYKNDGGGNFTEVPNTPFPPLYYADIAFANFDNDGNMDILVTGATGYANSNPSQPVAKIYTNDGNGNFSELTGLNFSGLYMSSVACGDIDNDGDVDVLMMGLDGNSSPRTYLYMNNGNGTFTAVANNGFAGLAQGHVRFADMDGDNDLDVLQSGLDQSYNPHTDLYLNDGSGNFSPVPNSPFPAVAGGSFAIADFDNDGDADVVLSGSTTSVAVTKLYVNNGSAGFSEVSAPVFEAVFESATAVGDIDNDGLLDILIIGGDDADVPKTSLYHNQSSLSIGRDAAVNDVALAYPNPTAAFIHLKFNGHFSNAHLELFDITGRSVYKTAFSGDKKTLDLTTLADGTYLLKVNGRGHLKVMKQTP